MQRCSEINRYNTYIDGAKAGLASHIMSWNKSTRTLYSYGLFITL